jgi:hypothetical protein
MKVIKMGGSCNMHDRYEKCMPNLVGKPEGLAIRRRRWENNIKMDFKEVWWCNVVG